LEMLQTSVAPCKQSSQVHLKEPFSHRMCYFPIFKNISALFLHVVRVPPRIQRLSFFREATLPPLQDVMNQILT
jgi:hypothetical protein